MNKIIYILLLFLTPNLFSQEYEMLITNYETDNVTYPFIQEGMKIQIFTSNDPPALAVSKYNIDTGRFIPVKAFYITEFLNNPNRDGNNWLELREDTFGKFVIYYNPKTREATFSDWGSKYPQKFTFISDKTTINNRVDSIKKQYNKNVVIVNDAIKLIAQKIESNDGIVENEMIKEFEGIKSKFSNYIPSLYYEHLEKLKKDYSEKIQKNKLNEIIRLTDLTYNEEKISSLYSDLDKENKSKYSEFVWDYLNSYRVKIDFQRLLTKSEIKSFLLKKRKDGVIDNSVIVFDEINKEIGFKFNIKTSTFTYNLEKGVIVCALSVRPSNSDFTDAKYRKLKKSNGKLLGYVFKIKDPVLLKKLENLDNRNTYFQKYLLDESKKKKIKIKSTFIEKIDFEETFIFYNTLIKTRNKGNLVFSFEGWDLEKGIDIFEINNGQVKPAPDGDYRLEDKRRITISSGKITRVRDQSILGQFGDAALEGAIDGIKN